MSAKPGPLPAYLSVIYFQLKPEGFNDFMNGAKQVNEAFAKTNTPRSTSYWYTLANGGSGPEVVLVQERKSISEMAGTTTKTLDELMKEAYGDEGSTNLMTLRKAYYRTESQLLHYRPDLSYMAPTTMSPRLSRRSPLRYSTVIFGRPWRASFAASLSFTRSMSRII
jgi:hypothetical protein